MIVGGGYGGREGHKKVFCGFGHVEDRGLQIVWTGRVGASKRDCTHGTLDCRVDNSGNYDKRSPFKEAYGSERTCC